MHSFTGNSHVENLEAITEGMSLNCYAVRTFPDLFFYRHFVAALIFYFTNVNRTGLSPYPEQCRDLPDVRTPYLEEVAFDYDAIFVSVETLSMLNLETSSFPTLKIVRNKYRSFFENISLISNNCLFTTCQN